MFDKQKTALKTNSNKQGTKTKTKPVIVGQSKPADKISDEPGNIILYRDSILSGLKHLRYTMRLKLA